MTSISCQTNHVSIIDVELAAAESQVKADGYVQTNLCEWALKVPTFQQFFAVTSLSLERQFTFHKLGEYIHYEK